MIFKIKKRKWLVMTILLLLKIVEVLERILESGPSHVAEILGIDDYVAQIIFSETNNKKYY